MSDAPKGGRYFGPARFFLAGDRVLAQRHISEARMLLGYMRDQRAHGGPTYQVQQLTLTDGTTIRGIMNNNLFQAEIVSPGGKRAVITLPPFIYRREHDLDVDGYDEHYIRQPTIDDPLVVEDYRFYACGAVIPQLATPWGNNEWYGADRDDVVSFVAHGTGFYPQWQLQVYRYGVVEPRYSNPLLFNTPVSQAAHSEWVFHNGRAVWFNPVYPSRPGTWPEIVGVSMFRGRIIVAVFRRANNTMQGTVEIYAQQSGWTLLASTVPVNAATTWVSNAGINFSASGSRAVGIYTVSSPAKTLMHVDLSEGEGGLAAAISFTSTGWAIAADYRGEELRVFTMSSAFFTDVPVYSINDEPVFTYMNDPGESLPDLLWFDLRTEIMFFQVGVKIPDSFNFDITLWCRTASGDIKPIAHLGEVQAGVNSFPSSLRAKAYGDNAIVSINAFNGTSYTRTVLYVCGETVEDVTSEFVGDNVIGMIGIPHKLDVPA